MRLACSARVASAAPKEGVKAAEPQLLLGSERGGDPSRMVTVRERILSSFTSGCWSPLAFLEALPLRESPKTETEEAAASEHACQRL